MQSVTLETRRYLEKPLPLGIGLGLALTAGQINKVQLPSSILHELNLVPCESGESNAPNVVFAILAWLTALDGDNKYGM